MAVTSEHSMNLREKIDVGYKNEICEVFELASQNYLEAKFVDGEREGPIHNAIFNIVLTCGEFVGQGKGPTKYAAKLQAAQQILPDLRLLPRDENPNKKRKKKRGSALYERALLEPEKPVLETLNELVTNLRGKPAEFTLVDVNKDSYPCILSMKLVVAGETVLARGHNKKEAKRNAAAKMLNIFGYCCSVSEPDFVAVEEVAQELSTQQEVEIQPTVEEMGPVLSIVAATEEIDMNNEDFQLCATSQQPDNQALSVTVGGTVDGTDVSKNIRPEKGLSPHQEIVYVCSLSETTTEEPQICNTADNHQELVESEQSLQETETEVEAPEMSSYKVDIADPIDQEFSPEIILEPALTEEGDHLIINKEATLEENNPQANIHYLPDDIRSMLAYMGVITENNGTFDWAESTTNEERQTSPTEDQTRDESVSVVSNRHEDQEELSPIDPPCPEETSVCPVEENTEATNKSSETLYEEKSENLISNKPNEEREVSLIDPPRPEEISRSIVAESLESFEEKCENLIPDKPEDLEKACQEEDNISIIQESMKPAKKTTTLTIDLTLSPNPDFKSCEEKCETLIPDRPEDLDKVCQEEDHISIIQESMKPAKKTTTLTIDLTLSPNPKFKSFEETHDNLSSDRPEGLHPVDKSCQEEDNISIEEESLESANVAPETEACKTTARKTAHYMTRSFVRKVFEMDGEEDDLRARTLRTIDLQRKVEKSIIIDNNQCQFKPEQLEKIGKKVAKRLKIKNGSIEEFEPDVLEQFNTELRTLQNRPKSGLARFFSRVRKAFTF